MAKVNDSGTDGLSFDFSPRLSLLSPSMDDVTSLVTLLSMKFIDSIDRREVAIRMRRDLWI